MRKLVIGVAATIVAWLAVSVLLVAIFSVVNPIAELAVAISSDYRSALSNYTTLNGLLILVLTIVLGRVLYRSWVKRWGSPSPAPGPIAGSSVSEGMPKSTALVGRLTQLDEAHKAGAITDAEYVTKRAQALEEA